MLSQNQKALITRQFALVAPRADAFATTFYEQLFRIAPSLRSLFPHDLADQRRKLIAALALVVNSLDQLDSIASALCELGQRHFAYGAEEEHFTIVGEAILHALEEHLGNVFGEQAQSAWGVAYSVVADVMLDGLRCKSAKAA